MKKLTEQKAMAFLATENAPREALAAGWTPSDFRAAGWTPSAFRAAGWTPSAFLAAGWTPSDLKEADEEWASIPEIEKPYSTMLADIEAKRRIHDQSTFGPDCDPKQNLCGTPMCTAGSLVNMAGEVGYKLRHKYGWEMAARMIHMKNRPDAPVQNFGSIPQKFALAYIRERAAEEQEKKP